MTLSFPYLTMADFVQVVQAIREEAVRTEAVRMEVVAMVRALTFV